MNITTYATANEARDAAIEWHHWVNDQNLSYGELLEYQNQWEQAVADFPELADEFEENGII